MPLVSVVIPFYNGVDWLCEAVDSVLNQTMKDFEILVINDGSPEDVSDFLERYGDKIVYRYKENGGPATARNLGLSIATGKYVAFLDSDDLWLEDHLEVQTAAMESHKAAWSYGAYRTFGVGKSKEYSMTQYDEPRYQRWHSRYIATPCVMVLKSVFDQYPDCRFNPDMRYGQDAYCWVVINSYFPILALPQCLAKVRVRGTNAAKRARVQLKVRSDMWKTYVANEKWRTQFQYTAAKKCSAKLCVFGDRIVSKVEGKWSPAAVEFLSKVLFALPWAITKIGRFIQKLR